MCDHVRMLGLSSRHAVFEETIPTDILSEAVDLIHGFIKLS